MEDTLFYLNDYTPHYDGTVEYQENDLCLYDGVLSVYIMDMRTSKLVWMNKDNYHQYDMFIE